MNVLMIFADQQHKYALGKVNPQYITPNLDALADEGILFTNAYSPNPVCGPFRACLLTGQYSSHHKAADNASALPDAYPNLAQHLKGAGWECAYVGKYHLGGNGNIPIPENLRRGFTYFMGYQCYNGFDPTPPRKNEILFRDMDNNAHIFQRHRTDVTADLAVEMLEEMARRKKPFFAAVSFQAPHYPEQPSDPYYALYRDTVFQKTPDYVEGIDPYTPTYTPPSAKPKENDPDYQRYGGNMDEYLRCYAALVSQVDAGVGKIIDALHALNLWDDTMVIYTADHGDLQGSHGQLNKSQPFEKSAGVPFIVRTPEGPRGLVSDALISGLDIPATALELAGVDDHGQGDGKSFVQYVRTGEGRIHDYVISEYPVCHSGEYTWQMVRTPKYKLTVVPGTLKPISLFDMEADPYELCDRKDDPEMAGQIQKMTEIIQKEIYETNEG